MCHLLMMFVWSYETHCPFGLYILSDVHASWLISKYENGEFKKIGAVPKQFSSPVGL